jgi:hypothetical protein
MMLLPVSLRGPSVQSRFRDAQGDLLLRPTVCQAGFGLMRPNWPRRRMVQARFFMPIPALARTRLDLSRFGAAPLTGQSRLA